MPYERAEIHRSSQKDDLCRTHRGKIILDWHGNGGKMAPGSMQMVNPC
jgi:hypothetical protein